MPVTRALGGPDVHRLNLERPDHPHASSRFTGAAERPVPTSIGRQLAQAAGAPYLLSLALRFALAKNLTKLAEWAADASASFGRLPVRGHIAVARLRQRQGRCSEALAQLRRAVLRDDDARRAHWALARLLLSEERTNISPEAVQDCRTELVKTLKIAANSSDANIRFAASLALANMLHLMGETGQAFEAGEAALRLMPQNARALRAKANSLLPMGQVAEARSLYAEIIAREPDDKLRNMLRQVEKLSGQAGPSSKEAVEPGTAILVGVGNGIGDILHATPTIRNLARRAGAPVDVLVLSDHPGAEFLVNDSDYVRRVHLLTDEVLQQPYRSVLLLHSFGPWRFAFNAQRIGAASQWRSFRPGVLQETLFNLEAAKHLLGVPYDAADAEDYFAGDLKYNPPRDTLVGIHAGSKHGRWLSKRWPYFAELARRLGSGGVRVASFGTADEYVDGTENRTGGSIAEMCRSICDCTVFISNDSGLMHIANALGIPTLALFAPTDPLTHLPLRKTTLALALEKACSPCEVKDHRYFASGACRCIAEIEVDVVESKVVEMLQAAAQSHAAVPELTEGHT